MLKLLVAFFSTCKLTASEKWYNRLTDMKGFSKALQSQMCTVTHAYIHAFLFEFSAHAHFKSSDYKILEKRDKYRNPHCTCAEGLPSLVQALSCHQYKLRATVHSAEDQGASLIHHTTLPPSPTSPFPHFSHYSVPILTQIPYVRVYVWASLNYHSKDYLYASLSHQLLQKDFKLVHCSCIIFC